MSEIKSRADLFEAAAKMMRMCDEAGICYFHKFDGLLYRGLDGVPFVYQPERYEFPLAIVEGKPVFKGDELYDAYGRLVKAEEGNKWDGDDYISLKTDGRWYPLTDYSWLPPKPRTVMVELLREDAEWLNNMKDNPLTYCRISEACRKALEEK